MEEISLLKELEEAPGGSRRLQEAPPPQSRQVALVSWWRNQQTDIKTVQPAKQQKVADVLLTPNTPNMFTAAPASQVLQGAPPWHLCSLDTRGRPLLVLV